MIRSKIYESRSNQAKEVKINKNSNGTLLAFEGPFRTTKCCVSKIEICLSYGLNYDFNL